MRSFWAAPRQACKPSSEAYKWQSAPASGRTPQPANLQAGHGQQTLPVAFLCFRLLAEVKHICGLELQNQFFVLVEHAPCPAQDAEIGACRGNALGIDSRF